MSVPPDQKKKNRFLRGATSPGFTDAFASTATSFSARGGDGRVG